MLLMKFKIRRKNPGREVGVGTSVRAMGAGVGTTTGVSVGALTGAEVGGLGASGTVGARTGVPVGTATESIHGSAPMAKLEVVEL